MEFLLHMNYPLKALRIIPLLHFIVLLFSSQSISVFLCPVCDTILSNTGKAPSIDSSANVSVFGDFNYPHKDWLTYSRKTYRPGELVITLLSEKILLR